MYKEEGRGKRVPLSRSRPIKRRGFIFLFPNKEDERKVRRKSMRLLMASLLTCLLVEGVTSVGSEEQQEKQPALMRKKRYLVFPQGSNVQLVYCLTIGAYGRAGDLVLGLTAALAWELPSKVEPKLAGLLHRRSRAAIYSKIEAFLQSLGIDGRSCVMRALCEAGQRSTFRIGTGSFLQELLHAVFTITSASDVSEFNSEYDRAHSFTGNCSHLYSSCKHSIYNLKF